MTCEFCGAPTGWVDGQSLERANESKRAAMKEAAALRAALATPPVESVETAIQSLCRALAESKGWLTGYADAIIRDAIDQRGVESVARDAAYTLDQIASACVYAEVSDGQFESMSIALAGHKEQQP